MDQAEDRKMVSRRCLEEDRSCRGQLQSGLGLSWTRLRPLLLKHLWGSFPLWYPCLIFLGLLLAEGLWVSPVVEILVRRSISFADGKTRLPYRWCDRAPNPIGQSRLQAVCMFIVINTTLICGRLTHQLTFRGAGFALPKRSVSQSTSNPRGYPSYFVSCSSSSSHFASHAKQSSSDVGMPCSRRASAKFLSVLTLPAWELGSTEAVESCSGSGDLTRGGVATGVENAEASRFSILSMSHRRD